MLKKITLCALIAATAGFGLTNCGKSYKKLPKTHITHKIKVNTFRNNHINQTLLQNPQIKSFVDEHGEDAIQPVLKKCIKIGIANPTKISNLLKIIAKNSGEEYTNRIYHLLPRTLDALYEKEIKADDTLDLLKTIAENARERTIWAYEELPTAVDALYEKEIKGDKALDFLKIHAETSKGDTNQTYRLLPMALDDLYEKEIKGDDALDLLKTIAENCGAYNDWVYFFSDALDALYDKKIKGDDALDVLKIIAENAREQIWDAYEYLPGALDAYKPISNVPSFVKGYGILVRRTGYGIITNPDLKPDLSIIKDRKSLAKSVAEAIDNCLSNNPRESNKVAVLINEMHDYDESDDLIRKTMTQNLDLSSVYYLMSVGGADLYTSTFEKLYYYNLMQGEDYPTPKFPNWLNEIKNNIDPHKKQILDFALTLSNYNKLKDVIKTDPTFFMDTIKSAMHDDEPKLRENNVKLTPTIQELFTNNNLKQFKQDIENFLISSYKANYNNKLKRAIFGYNIKLNKDYFSNENKQKANNISNSLPEILKPTIPKEWLNDDTLTAKLYFTQKAWLPTTRDEFFGTGATKKDGTLKGFFEFHETNSLPKNKPYNKRNTFILEPNPSSKFYQNGLINGVKLRIILTTKLEDLTTEVDNPNIDHIAHRGHSYSERDLFIPKIPNSNAKKLIQLGSCGGFGRVAKIQKKLPQSYYLSDDTMGEGAANTRILFYITRSIAQRKNQDVIMWEEIESDIIASYKKIGLKYPPGIVWPHEKALLLNPFIEEVLIKGVKEGITSLN